MNQAQVMAFRQLREQMSAVLEVIAALSKSVSALEQQVAQMQGPARSERKSYRVIGEAN